MVDVDKLINNLAFINDSIGEILIYTANKLHPFLQSLLTFMRVSKPILGCFFYKAQL